MNDADINFTKEAFLNPWNLGFLIMSMLAAFFLSGTVGAQAPFNLVLILAAAVELMYLGIVPRQDSFKKRIKMQREKERLKPPSQKEIYLRLSKQSQRRYALLRKTEKEIQSNYRKLSYASQGLLDSHLKKINGLIESYIKLLYQKERYEDSVRSGAEKDIVRRHPGASGLNSIANRNVYALSKSAAYVSWSSDWIVISVAAKIWRSSRSNWRLFRMSSNTSTNNL